MRTGPEASPRASALRRASRGALLLALATACTEQAKRSDPDAASSSAAGSVGSAPPPFAPPHVPQPLSSPRSGDAQLAELDARIEAQRGKPTPPGSDERGVLALALLERFEILARPDDLRAATEALESPDPFGHLSDESFVARFQLRFLRGEHAIFELGHLPPPKRKTPERPLHSTASTEALLERGLCAWAHSRVSKPSEHDVDHQRRRVLALVLARMGRDAEADEAFAESARRTYDRNPLTLARVYLDHGRFSQARGDMARAEALYRAALERLPSYVPAAVALAPMLGPERGIALLEPFVAEGCAPEIAATLALLNELRRPGSGSAWLERAKAGFDAALEVAPDRYRPIAARTWLRLGVNTQEAFELAKLAVRRESSPDTHAILFDAARAADRVPEWCEIAAASRFLPDCDERGQPPASLPRCR